MGMYTQIMFKGSVKKEAAPILKYLVDPKNNPKPLVVPNHPFFNTHRWECIALSSSYYHHPAPMGSVVESHVDQSVYVQFVADLKNYDREIEQFFDWIRPHLDTGNGYKCIGYKWYEEDEQPTLIYWEAT